MWSATVAVNGARYDAQAKQQVVTTTYVRLVAFGWLAEQLSEMDLKQGEEVLVVGELDNTEREKADGTTERKTSVSVLTLVPTRRRQQVRPVAPQQPPGAPW